MEMRRAGTPALTTLFIRALTTGFFCVGIAASLLGLLSIQLKAGGGTGYAGLGFILGAFLFAMGGANTVCTLLYFIYPKVGKYSLLALAILNCLFLLISYGARSLSGSTVYLVMGMVWLICNASLFFLVLFHPKSRRKRKKLGLCLNCGYDLRASKERCPECGEEFGSTNVEVPAT